MYAKPNQKFINGVPEIKELRVQVTSIEELGKSTPTFTGVVIVAAGDYYVNYDSYLWTVAHFDFVKELVVIPLIL